MLLKEASGPFSYRSMICNHWPAFSGPWCDTMWFVRSSVISERLHSLILKTLALDIMSTLAGPTDLVSFPPTLSSHTVSTTRTLQILYFLSWKTTWPGYMFSQSWARLKSEIQTFAEVCKAVCGYTAEMGAFLGKPLHHLYLNFRYQVYKSLQEKWGSPDVFR